MAVGKVLVLVGLIKLLLLTEKPLVCAGIYTGLSLVLAAILCGSLTWEIAGYAGIGFALALLYFWLLNRFQGSIALFLLVAVLGLAIGLV